MQKDSVNHKLVQKALYKMHAMLPTKKTTSSKEDQEIIINNEKYYLASFNRRLLSAALDMFIISILIIPFSQIISYLGLGEEIVNMQTTSEAMLDEVDMFTFMRILYDSGVILHVILMQLVLFLVIGIYMITLWFKKGSTPAKMLFKCKIVDATTYNKISLKQGIIRFLSIPLSILPIFMGLFMIDFSSKRQALHDKIANTIVIYKKKQQLKASTS
jgi:uncharacterized RDD family membrane protein YckC